MRITLRRLAILATVAGSLVAALLVPPALSTPGSGASPTLLARGKAVDKIKTKGKEAFDVVVQEITFTPGGQSGWHSHPGQAIVVIESGTFTTYRAVGGDDDDDDDADDDDKARCEKKVYRAGEVYVDPGYGNVHIARNESASENLVVTVTYIDVPVGGAFRIDADQPAACANI